MKPLMQTSASFPTMQNSLSWGAGINTQAKVHTDARWKTVRALECPIWEKVARPQRGSNLLEGPEPRLPNPRQAFV